MKNFAIIPGWQPRSLQHLILLAFLIVVAPLCLLIFQSSKALTHQNDVLREYAHQALDSTARAQTLNQIAEDLLRASRQLQIVNRAEITQRLQQQASMYKVELGVQSFWLTRSNQMLTELNTLLDTLLAQPDHADTAQTLYSRTLSLEKTLRLQLKDRLDTLNRESSQIRQKVWLQTLFLLSLSALLIVLMLGTINRPIQQLCSRIRALGRGERQPLENPRGPQELRTLHKELNWLANQLSGLEHEKQRFLRHMSHELKTPLTSLREGADLMAEGITGQLNAQQQEVVALLQSQSRALHTLIEQLLDYNRLGEGVQLQPESVEISTVLQQALAPFTLMVQQKQLHLVMPQAPFVWKTDPALLQRVLANLLSNAVLYGKPSGTLSVTLQQQTDALWIDVSNQGPLIADDDLPHLFEPFYQGKNRRSGPVKGSGIGLSLAQDAAIALGGQLTLQHNAQDKVVFRLCIPEASTTQQTNSDTTV